MSDGCNYYYKFNYHSCYMIHHNSTKVYIGYTVNFLRRIRQHNREIKGGAKKTGRWYPWYPICLIRGFRDNSTALRFEYRLQRCKVRRNRGEKTIDHHVRKLNWLSRDGDGRKPNKVSWPKLTVYWYTANCPKSTPNITYLDIYKVHKITYR